VNRTAGSEDASAAPPGRDPHLEVFFDGACPLCSKEIAFLRNRDHKGRIRFRDIADPSFDPAELGLTHQALMARMHARLPDGTLIDGVEVFRRLYAAIGFGPIVSLSRLPGIRQALDAAYDVFAKNRLRLTGRCTDGVCEVHQSDRKGVDRAAN